MHLLVIILQQLFGLLREKTQRRQPEVVRRDEPARRGPPQDACQRLVVEALGDMTIAEQWQPPARGPSTRLDSPTGFLAPPGLDRRRGRGPSH